MEVMREFYVERIIGILRLGSSTMELSCTRAPGHLSPSCEHRATL